MDNNFVENVLAESNHYIINHNYETVNLKFKGKQKQVVIGDFYGDPETAFISSDENFCAVGGCGIIIYYLKEPFTEYEYDMISNQWKEIFRQKDDIWWINSIKEGSSADCIKFIINTDGDKEKAGTYEINVFTLDVRKIY